MGCCYCYCYSVVQKRPKNLNASKDGWTPLVPQFQRCVETVFDQPCLLQLHKRRSNVWPTGHAMLFCQCEIPCNACAAHAQNCKAAQFYLSIHNKSAHVARRAVNVMYMCCACCTRVVGVTHVRCTRVSRMFCGKSQASLC